MSRAMTTFTRTVGILGGLCLPIAWSAPAPAQQVDGSALREQRALQSARQLEASGRAEEAMQALEGLLAEQPASVSALALMFELAAAQGDPDRVLPGIERAVREDDTGMPALRQIWVRTLASAGLTDSARAVAARWIEGDPGEAAGWEELSALELAAGDLDAAIDVLERGRRAIGSDRYFVQVLAGLYVAAGRFADAASEWQVMLGWGDAGVAAVARSLNGLGVDRPAAIAPLRARIDRPGAGRVQRKGALDLALGLGEAEWARHIVEQAVREMQDPDADDLLADYARRAGPAGDPAGAAWAARLLSERAGSTDGADEWLIRAAELAVEAGDTIGARRSLAALVNRSTAGSETYRRSLGRLHAVTAPSDPDSALVLLRRYQAAYPEDASGAAAMSVLGAEGLIAAGDLAAAREILEEVPLEGATAGARSRALGRLELLEGRPAAARRHLEVGAAAAADRPRDRIAAIELLDLVTRADSAAVAELGRGSLAAIVDGDPGPLVGAVDRWRADRVPMGAALSRRAARELEEAGFAEEAARVRELLVRAWPDSAEAAAALLQLARSASDDPSSAVRWLERLVVDHSDSALAPEARRMLAGLRQAGEGTDLR